MLANLRNLSGKEKEEEKQERREGEKERQRREAVPHGLCCWLQVSWGFLPFVFILGTRLKELPLSETFCIHSRGER